MSEVGLERNHTREEEGEAEEESANLIVGYAFMMRIEQDRLMSYE